MPHITLNGTKFKLKDDPPKYGRLMLLARAEESGDERKIMAAYANFIEGLIPDPVEKWDGGWVKSSRLEYEEAFAELDPADIGKALEEASNTYATDPSSAGTSGDSASGSPAVTPIRKVVSLSKGTVREVS
jgi:hypothetical protein